MRKNFYPQEKKRFLCLHCGQENDDPGPSPRNHCKHCLTSLHLDEAVPGDRASHCGGIMRAISLNQSGKKGFIILHQCESCGKTVKNKASPDDNHDLFIKLAQHAFPV